MEPHQNENAQHLQQNQQHHEQQISQKQQHLNHERQQSGTARKNEHYNHNQQSHKKKKGKEENEEQQSPTQQIRPVMDEASNSAAPQMTAAVLREICRKSGQYQTPALNERLYLHFKGFTKIQELDAYTQLKALWLEGNGIRRIEGLDNIKELRCLFLQQNCIKKIENLDNCKNLTVLDLSHNNLRTITGLAELKQLSNLKLAHNAFQRLPDIHGLLECPSISSLDLSHNFIDLEDSQSSPTHPEALKLASEPQKNQSAIAGEAETTEVDEQHIHGRSATQEGYPKNVGEYSKGATEQASYAEGDANSPDSWMTQFLYVCKQLPNLACLYFYGNPIIPRLSYYRKRLVAALPNLTYLDDRPVKALERTVCEAWAQGGKAAESAAIMANSAAEQTKRNRMLEDFRTMQQRHRETIKRALLRIEREEHDRKTMTSAREDEGGAVPQGASIAWSEERNRQEILHTNSVREKWLKLANEAQQSILEPLRNAENEAVQGSAAAEEDSRFMDLTSTMSYITLRDGSARSLGESQTTATPPRNTGAPLDGSLISEIGTQEEVTSLCLDCSVGGEIQSCLEECSS